MHWRCEECGELLGHVIRIPGRVIPKEKVAFCPHCHRVTSQAPANLPNYRKIRERAKALK